MFKNVNNWHLSILVVVVSVFSLLLIQQNVFAQWEDPIGLPGESTNFRLLVNPLAEDLNMNGYRIFDTDFVIDPSAAGSDKITVDNGNIRINSGSLCLEGDCQNTWPVGGGDDGDWAFNAGNIYRGSGKVGIGTANPAHTLHIQDGTGQLKLDGNHIYHPGSTLLEIESGGDLRLSADNIARLHIEADDGNIGIRHADPGYPLHIADNNDTAILNIENFGDDLWTGTRVARDGAERWFMGMGDAAYGTADELLFRSNANQDVMTLTSAGHVGIGTVDPQAYLEIVGDEPGGTVDLRLYNTGGSNSRILFKEYASLDDFAIEYNGNVGGWNNWLEFWGRNPSQHGDRPIMTMQRDYNPDENNYNGIGIGVPGSTHIDATLRVQNYGDEDVFQVYADDAEVLSVTDAGELCLNGVCSTSLFSSPAPLTYNVGAYVTTHMGEATAGCYSGFALTDWSCSGSHLNKCSQNAMQGIVGSIGGDASATGVCTRFDPAPPVDPPDTYAVSCSANGWDTCTVGCPAGSYALTDWSCSGSPSACSQGADTGSATCNGSACSGAGTCTEI